MPFCQTIKILLIIIPLVSLTNCSPFKSQSHQVTINTRLTPAGIDECELYISKVSLEMLAQNKSKWENIKFNDMAGLRSFIAFIKNDIDVYTKNNKNYVKARGSDPKYVEIEEKFYAKLLNFIADKPDKRFSLENFLDWIKGPWRKSSNI